MPSNKPSFRLAWNKKTSIVSSAIFFLFFRVFFLTFWAIYTKVVLTKQRVDAGTWQECCICVVTDDLFRITFIIVYLFSNVIIILLASHSSSLICFIKHSELDFFSWMLMKEVVGGETPCFVFSLLELHKTFSVLTLTLKFSFICKHWKGVSCWENLKHFM